MVKKERNYTKRRENREDSTIITYSYTNEHGSEYYEVSSPTTQEAMGIYLSLRESEKTRQKQRPRGLSYG